MSTTCLEEIHSARLLAVYANEQSAQGTAATDYAAADAVAVQSAQGRGAPVYSTPARKGPGFGAAAITPLRERGVHELTIGGPLIPSGTTGSTCNLHALLKASSFMDVDSASDTTVSGGSSTTTVVDVADASNYTAHVSAVEIGGEICIVTAVDTASTPDNITVSPPLSSAPADTTAVNGVTTYRLSNSTHLTQNLTTVHAISGGGMDLILLIDAALSSMSLSAGMEGEVQYEMQLSGGSGGESSRLTLSSGIGTGDTAIPINESGTDVPPVGSVLQVKGGSETGMVVTASVSGGNVTVTRGSNPDTGSTSDKLDYYIPGFTIPDDGIPARSGELYFGSDTSVCDAGLTLNINLDLQKVECRANLDQFCRVSPGNVEVTADLVLPLDRASYGKIRASMSGAYDAFVARFGSASGKTALIYGQKATFKELPGFDASGDGPMELNTTLSLQGNSDTERPVVIAIQ